jgi:hypothetical protein
MSSFLGTVLMSFALTALLKYFIFQYHYISLSLSLLFISSYTLVFFLHTNANPLLCNSSFNYTVHLLTLICLFCPSYPCFTRFLYPDTWSSTSILQSVLCTCLSYSLYQVQSQQIHWLLNSVHPLFSCKVYCESYQIRSVPHHMPTLQFHT